MSAQRSSSRGDGEHHPAPASQDLDEAATDNHADVVVAIAAEGGLPVEQQLILQQTSQVAKELEPLSLPGMPQLKEQIALATRHLARINKPCESGLFGPAGAGKSEAANAAAATPAVRDALMKAAPERRRGMTLPDAFPLRSTLGIGLHVTKEVTCLRRPREDRGLMLRVVLIFSSRSDIERRAKDLRLPPEAVETLEAFIVDYGDPASASLSRREVVLVDTSDVFEFIEVTGQLDAQLQAERPSGRFPSGVPSLPAHATIGLLERIFEGPWALPQEPGKDSFALYDTIGFTEGGDVDSNASTQDRSQGASWKNAAVIKRVDAVLLVCSRLPTMSYIGELGRMGAFLPRNGESAAALVILPLASRAEFGEWSADGSESKSEQELKYVDNLAAFNNAARTLVHTCGLSRTLTLAPDGVSLTGRQRMRIANSLVLRTAALPRFVAIEHPDALWNLLRERSNEDATTAATEIQCSVTLELSRLLKVIVTQKETKQSTRPEPIPRDKIDNPNVHEFVGNGVTQLLLDTAAAVDNRSVGAAVLELLRHVVENVLDELIAERVQLNVRASNKQNAAAYAIGSAGQDDEAGSAFERNERFFDPFWETLVSAFNDSDDHSAPSPPVQECSSLDAPSLIDRWTPLQRKLQAHPVAKKLNLPAIVSAWDKTVNGWSKELDMLRDKIKSREEIQSGDDDHSHREPSSDADPLFETESDVDDAEAAADARTVASKIAKLAIRRLFAVLIASLEVLRDAYAPIVPADTKSRANSLGIPIKQLALNSDALKKKSQAWSARHRPRSFVWTGDKLFHSEHFLPQDDALVDVVLRSVTENKKLKDPPLDDSSPYFPDLELINTAVTGDWDVTTATSSQLPVVCVDLQTKASANTKVYAPQAVVDAFGRITHGLGVPIFIPSWCPSDTELADISELNLQLATGRESRGRMLDGLPHIVFVVVEALQWRKYYEYLRSCAGLCGVVLAVVNLSAGHSQDPEAEFFRQSAHLQSEALQMVRRQKFSGSRHKPASPVKAPARSSPREEASEPETCLRATCLVNACQQIALSLGAVYWSLADHCLLDSVQWSVQRIASESCTFARCLRGGEMVLSELDELHKKNLAPDIEKWKRVLKRAEHDAVASEFEAYDRNWKETKKSLQFDEDALLQDIFDGFLSTALRVRDRGYFSTGKKNDIELLCREIEAKRQKVNTVHTVDFGAKRYQVHSMLPGSRPWSNVLVRPTRGYYGMGFFRGRGAAPFWAQRKRQNPSKYVEKRQNLYDFSDSIYKAFQGLRYSTHGKAVLHAKCDLWSVENFFPASSGTPGPVAIAKAALSFNVDAYTEEYHGDHPCKRSWDDMCKALEESEQFVGDPTSGFSLKKKAPARPPHSPKSASSSSSASRKPASQKSRKRSALSDQSSRSSKRARHHSESSEDSEG